MSIDTRALQTVLGERYQLGDQIGSGGMATVFQARDHKLSRDVAVKVLRPELAPAIGLDRFQREILVAASLQHPNIVPLFDSGGDDNLLYYIMPLIVGESLRDRLDREPQFTDTDIISIASDVAAALAHAHAHNIVHRDIKPENILLRDGKAMVTDFGIAHAVFSVELTKITEVGVVMGTPAYMSPEQAMGTDTIDGRADVYALGCVVYEMVAGSPPFTGRTRQALLARQIVETPPSLRVLRPMVSETIHVAVERSLAKVPADRFATATAFADALGSSMSQRVSARRLISTRTALFALVGMAATAALVVYLSAEHTPPPDRNTVVVYPLSVPGAGKDDGTGQSVALLIGSALEHTEPLRWLDGQALLSKNGIVDAVPVGVESARAARRAGAAFYLDGAIVTDGDSLTVILRLHDAVQDTLLRQESVTGSASMTSAAQVALRAVALILPRLLPANGQIDLSYIADRSPAAIADWLQGEREYAHSGYQAALGHMHRALERDSAMGVAALKGAQAAAHLEDYQVARQLVNIALKLDRQLPTRHLLLARGLQFYLAGSADSALQNFIAARAADTTWSEPWMWMGETYYHLMPSVSHLDSQAVNAFEGAVRINNSFAPALFHLTEFAALRGDVSRARALFTRFASVSPDSDWTFQADLTVRCAEKGPSAIDWPAAVHRASDRVVNVARVLGGGARYPACAHRAMASVLAYDTITNAEHTIYRWSALKGLTYQTMTEGRERTVIAMLDSARARGVRAAVSLHILNAEAGSKLADVHADSAIAGLMALPIHQMNTVRLRYLALWTWHHRDTVRLDSVERRIRTIADSSGASSDRLVYQGAAARLALLRHDSTTALTLLQSMRPAAEVGPLTWDLWECLASERLLMAQLQLDMGDPQAAIETAALFDSPRAQIHMLYLPASFALRARAAVRMGRVSEHDRYVARLRALRSGPTP